MFDQPLNITLLKKEDLKSTISDPKFPDSRKTFKVKTTDGKPYLIYLVRYDKNYYFVKFHPSRYTSSNEKYRLRFVKNSKNKNLSNPNKILSSCLKVAVDELKNNPNACLGIYGQWDRKDIANNKQTSQRFNIWYKIAISKINPENYRFIKDEEFNFFMVIPTNKYNDKIKMNIQSYFCKRFKTNLHEFRIPIIED